MTQQTIDDNSYNPYEALLAEGNVFVCEWLVVDFVMDIGEEKAQVLKTFDYTYHNDINSAQYASQLKTTGFLFAKDIIRNINDEKPKSLALKDLTCQSIWVYSDSLIGKYHYQESMDVWIPDLFKESWRDDYPDLIHMPSSKNLNF